VSEPRPHAPSTWRVIWLIGKLSWMRLTNRWVRRRGAKPGERGATARKPTAGRLVIVFASVLFALQAVAGSTVLIQRLAATAELEMAVSHAPHPTKGVRHREADLSGRASP